LASLAKSIDLQRTAQQGELSQSRCIFEKLVHLGDHYVLDPSASDTKDMVMRLHVAVIARNIVEKCYLARLSNLAKLLQNPMDCGQ
jgi:hypothetical protein